MSDINYHHYLKRQIDYQEQETFKGENALKDEPEFMSPSHGVMFLADTGETLLPQGIVAAEKNTFYRASPLGIYRTTDSGKSWHPFMNGIIGTTIHDLIAMNDTLYVNTGRDFLQSANGGETWETVRIDANTISKSLSCINRTPSTQIR